MDKFTPVLFSSHGGTLFSPAYVGDAGMDVETTEEAICLPGAVTKIPIGIRVAQPEGMVFTFMTRSSAVAQGLFVLPTLIDQYRGDLFLFVTNFTSEPVKVDKGVRLAQIVLLPNLMHDRTIEMVEKLPPSERGEKAFGTSGAALKARDAQ